jgi:hypothetical protein
VNLKSIAINWKTTAGGLASFLAVVVLVLKDVSAGVPLAQALTTPEVFGLILGYLGIVGKDGNVTGGSVVQATVVNPPVLPTPAVPATA